MFLWTSFSKTALLISKNTVLLKACSSVLPVEKKIPAVQQSRTNPQRRQGPPSIYQTFTKCTKKIVARASCSAASFTTASTQSRRPLEGPPEQACEGRCGRPQAPEPCWGPERQSVRQARGRPGSRRCCCRAWRRPSQKRRRSWRRRSAPLSHFCKAPVAEEGRLLRPGRRSGLGEACRGWWWWSGSRRPPGGWGGGSWCPSWRRRTWTGNGWPLPHTRWSRLCICSGRTGPRSQQLQRRKENLLSNTTRKADDWWIFCVMMAEDVNDF